ncbi:uncharacterized protein LOC131687206 isoform X2 [Topomyia yanbarensis]|uniref:uncharacterized protein LOC131687206 isoform X2 n=1 Tax=Topomyia yanbarensis TaxID=2498891 RepID=UPI00273AB350|nr:uncharacterized protein LOC131687206 isoform X2 [Topomyia yanbarensis]
MAPGASNNNNDNNHNRQTGTKPKTKSSKKNSVPREVVAPTRRDLQQQLNVLVDWATVSGVAAAAVNNQQHQQQQQQSGTGAGGPSNQQNFLLKPRNNRTPGEGTCYEIDNLALQDNSRYIPVRPIVRRNLLSESAGTEPGEQHNTAVGVVIPTTPNSALQTFRLNDAGSGSSAGINNLINNTGSQKHILNPFQQQQLQQQQQQHHQLSNLRASPLSSRVPDGASQNQLNLSKNSNQQQQQQFYGGGAIGGGNVSKTNFEDKLNQIQEYIKLTTNLISSVQTDNRKESQEGRKQNNASTMGDERCYFMPINSASLESVSHSDSELNGPRPQSVQSISTNNSTTPVQTPSYDELRFRMEGQNKNMQALKEQQAHLLRLQQAARQQLQEMEAIRQHTAAASVPLENFESVEQVQDGISGVMERMRVLATFIQNQQELGNLLGGDNEDVLSEQVMLQQKFQELRDKKSQMHNLVSELQNLNVEASRHFEGTNMVPVERNVPIELTNVPASAADMRKATKTFNQNNVELSVMNGSRGGSITPKVENVAAESEEGLHEEDDEEEEEEVEAAAGTADMLNDKINEINAMKSQLRRLKEMMDTVKLIEIKNGDSINEEEDIPEENDENPESDEESRSPSVASQISDQGPVGGEPSDKRREQLNQRVEALHAMTRDLREQAKSIAAERDALKIARTEVQKRRNNVAELQHSADTQTAEKLTNHVASLVSSMPPGPKEREQMALKAELEQKRIELERIEKMTHSIKKNTELSRRNTEVAPPKVSSVSSSDSLRSPNRPPVIPPPPAPSAVNNTNASNATHHSKNSVDSGVTDIFANAQLESGSYQSSSTRSLNMVPPMPDICNRADRYHRKSEDVGTSTARTDRTSPWPSHLFSGVGPSSSNTGPQSPHFHPFVGSEIHVSSAYPGYNTYPAYSNLLPPHTPNSAPPPPDPLMFQHFMQTQQMLMNSITQCNQLLWIQQREINNLNNAVLLLQERILNNSNNSILLGDVHVPGAGAHIRAESTPPNNSLNSAATLSGSVYNRARSEQPSMVHQQAPSSPYHTIAPTIPQTPYGSMTGSTNQFHSFTATTSHQPSAQFSINQQIQRNNSNISNANVSSNSSHRSYRNLRHVNINTANNAIYEQQQLQQQQQQQQPLYDHHVSMQQHSNNFMNLNNPLQTGAASANEDSNLQQQPYNNVSVGGGGSLVPSNMINNLANGPTTTMQTGSMPPAQPVCLNNLNNSNNSNAAQQTQALNNQVLPGVRANNYWDNFRSYSRQNLLSSNSCKSNEDSCALSSGSCTNNINNQIQRNNSNSNNYNNNTTGNVCSTTSYSSNSKYPSNFNRNNSLNNINQQTTSDMEPPTPQQPNMSHHQQSQSQQQQQQPQQQQQHYQSLAPVHRPDSASFQQMSQPVFHHQHQSQSQPQQQPQQHHTPLNQSNSFDLGELQFHTNPINLGLVSKSHPKGSGHKKYPLSLRSCRDGSLGGAETSSNFYGVGAHAEMVADLNLASASNYQHDSKSSSKLFEALKENVYQEVKNLITANESRPHFLIQLFRELQLISSDPLRQRTLQSIQELYNRYIESTLQQEQQEGHVNNVGSNNLLASSATGGSVGSGGPVDSAVGQQPSTGAENVEVIEVEVSQNFTNSRHQQQQQQQPHKQSGFQFVPNAESTPITNVAGIGSSSKANEMAPLSGSELQSNEIEISSSEIISIIMSDIVAVINSVDYINDSVLCKIAGVICNHATGPANGLFQQPQPQQQQEELLVNPMIGPSMAAFLAQNDADVISREDFLRHLESWNRTDKDEFISNLENLLNNILLRSSAVEGDGGAVSSSNMNGDEEGQMRAQMQHQQQQQQHHHDSLSSNGNGNNTTGDLSTDNNETFSYAGNEDPFSPHNSTVVGAIGGSRRLYGVSESDKMSNGVSSSNGYASTTYDLAEADQVCDMDKAHSAGAVGGGVPTVSASGSAAESIQHSMDERWRPIPRTLDDDLANMMERNRLVEMVTQYERKQQQQRQQQRQGEEDDIEVDRSLFY